MKKVSAVKKSVGRSADDFANQYDRSVLVPKAIRLGLTSLGKSWLTATEFARLCKISVQQLSQYADQFEGYHAYLSADRRTVWAGDKEFLASLMERVQ